MFKRIAEISLLFLLLWVGKAGAQDLHITTAISPVSGCNLPCESAVKVIIFNDGPAAIAASSFNVQYTVNGGPAVIETQPVAFMPVSASFTFTFSDSAELCNAGVYVIDVTVIFPGDPDLSDNTLSITVVSDTTVVGGTLASSDTVCMSGNAGTLNLTGYTGYIDHWEFSTDGGTNWDTIPDTTNIYNYLNLTQATTYQVILDGGLCPDGSSPWAVITVDDTSNAGFTIGDATVCGTGNSGLVNVTGITGNIQDWEYSTDGSSWTSLGSTNSSITYANLTTTTYYHVIVQNGVCPADTSTITTITVDAPPVPGVVMADTSVCYGSSGILTLTGYSGHIAFWTATTTSGTTPISDTTAFRPYTAITQTTYYTAILQNGVCPADTAVGATVTVLPLPVANAGADATIYLGSGTCLSASGGINYSWSPATMLDLTNIAGPCIDTATAVGIFTYTVTVTDANGCSDNDVVTVTVLDTAVSKPSVTPNLQVCNFITPNADSQNDVWNIIDIDYYPDNEVMIMNNHGQVLFQQKSYKNTWTGDGLPDGSYYYLVKIKELDKTFKGVLTITSSR